MKTRNAFKRFSAFLLALAMILCEMPAISARAEEGKVSFTGEETFELVAGDDYCDEKAFSEGWKTEDGKYCGNIFFEFPEGERPSLTDFAAQYSKYNASFKVCDMNTTGAVKACRFVANLSRTEGEPTENWLFNELETPVDLADGDIDVSVTLGETEIDETDGWIVTGLALDIEAEDVNTTFIIRSQNWVAPSYTDFTGKGTYSLINDENYQQRVDFSEGWTDRDRYCNLTGNWFPTDSTLTLGSFAETYGEILIETKIPKLAEGSDAKIDNININYKSDLEDEEEAEKSLCFSIADATFTEGTNSFSIDLSEAQYEEQYADYFISSITAIISSSNVEQVIKLYYKDAEIPSENVFYIATFWDWENNCLFEDTVVTSEYATTCGEGINIPFAYFAENEGGETVVNSICITNGGNSVLNEDIKIYYQPDDETDRVQCTEGVNYAGDEFLDPIISTESPYSIGYFIFRKAGIYTIECSNEDYSGSVQIYSNPSDWSFYDENNELMTSDKKFARKSGETITLAPSDKDKEYSIVVLSYMGYGSDGVTGRNFLTAKDSEGNDVTDKVCFTNVQILENDELKAYGDNENVKNMGVLPTMKGDTSFTLTDFAHDNVTIIVRYEGEDGYEVYSFVWNESDESLETSQRDTTYVNDDTETKGFLGYIVNEAEYRTGDIDWTSGEPLTVATGASMKEVIDKLSEAMRAGDAENYGYIWIEKGFIVNDPVSVENSKKEQYISSDIGGAADIKGVIIIATANEFDYNLEFTPEYITSMLAEMGGEDSIDGHPLAYSWLGDDEYTETLVLTVPVQWAQNINNPDDVVYMFPATQDNEYGYYFLNGTPEEGFTVTDPVIETNKVREESGVNYSVITNHEGGKYYQVMGWYGIQNEFPKLHVDATNEVFLLGNFAEVSSGEANIFMKLAAGSRSIINGDVYTLTEDGKVKVEPRSGGASFTLENGVITTNEGSYEHWQLGDVSYSYSVLVDKLEIKANNDFSEGSDIGDAEINPDIDSLFDQISDELTDEEKEKVDGGNTITLETDIADVTGNDIPDGMGDGIEDANPEKVEYVDIILEYFVGYGNDEGTKITETDDAVYLSITLLGDDYDTDPDKYIIGRYHEGVYEELAPESVEIIEGGVVVTFKSNKFSVYAIMYGSNRKTVSVEANEVNTTYSYGETPSPEGMTVTVNYESGDPDTYTASEAEELGYSWVLIKSDGSEASKDSAGFYPVGTYKWKLVDEDGDTVAVCSTEIIIRMSYTITYDLAGGTKKNEAAFITKYHSDTESVVLPTASDFNDETDYTFGGWYTSSAYKDSELVTTITPDKYKDYVLYAKWVAEKITVTFNANGGNNGGSTASVILYNRKKATLTANGFKDKTRAFMGWALETDATEVVFANKESVIVSKISDVSGGDPYLCTKINDVDVTSYITDGKVTLYAVWDNSFAITYMSDGEVYLEDTYQFGKKKTLDTTIKTTKPGYTFAGWYNSANKKVTEISKTSTGDVVLTAKWTANTYKVKYNKNVSSGVSGKMSETKMTYDTAKNLSVNKFMRPGYKFLGWSTDKNATEATYTDGAEVLNLKTSGTVTLYAVWTPTTYEMTFELCCDAEDVSGGEIAPITFSYSASKGESLPKPIRTNYSFVGWYKDAAYKTQVKSTKGLSDDITVYARWSTKYDIHFNKVNESATGTMTDLKNAEYSSAKELSSNKFSYTDVSGQPYAFMGWDTDESADEVVYTNKQKISYPEAIEMADGKFVLNLYAVWEKNWDINYELNGGTLPEGAATEYAYKTGTGSGSLPVPTKDGYTFSGWYKDSKFKTKVTTLSTGYTGDITLYAKWTGKKTKVKFVANAPTGRKSSGSMSSQTITIGSSKALTKNAFKVTGYTFLGWSTDAAATEPTYTNQQKVTNFGTYNANITLYAVWEVTEYKVTYKMGGVLDDVVETYTINSGYTLMDTPSKLGYTFQGFFTDKTYKKAAKNLSAGTTGDKVIYVKWKENK